MKKTVCISVCFLLVLLLLLPVGTLLCRLLGYRLELTKPWIYGLALSGLSAWTAFAAFPAADRQRCETAPKGENASAGDFPKAGIRLLYTLPLPLAIISTALLLLRSGGLPVFLCSAVTLAGCGCLCLLAQRGLPRRISLSLSVLLLLPLLLLAFGSLFFGGFGQRTVLRRLPSPDGSVCAELVDDDQGALGGATLVELCPRGWSGEWGVRLARQIYFGPWGEGNSLELRWKDERCLVIDGRDYPIP